MKDNLRKNPRVALAFMAGAFCSLIAGASAQSGGNEQVDPIFQSAPTSPNPTVVEVDNGSGGAPEVTAVVPANTAVQMQIQPAVQPQLPVQPLASDPSALQQLEQSINAQEPAQGSASSNTSGPVVRDNPSIATPYIVPREAEGIFENSDLTLREISFLTAEKDRLNAMSEREQALEAQIRARRAVEEAISEPTKAQAKAEEESKKAQEKAQEAEQSSPQAAGRAVAPQPFVNSIYSYDNKAYAEIFIGQNKVVATEGTVLITGERIVSITPQGVVISGKKGRQTLRVIGTAGGSL